MVDSLNPTENPSSRLPPADELTRLWHYLKPRERERLVELLGPRIDWRFCPHRPSKKQLLFLSIEDREALYGGAAGGGKSDAILMAFLQYVDIPHYRGLILRRNSTDLTKANSIMDRAFRWWVPAGVRFNSQQKRFTFPSGATCEFGHADVVGDEVRQYSGPEWQFIAFDELTQFDPVQYRFLFSRNRQASADGDVAIPLRVRAASNPGGKWHNYYRNRFMSDAFARSFLDGRSADYFVSEEVTAFGAWRKWFVPAKLDDNPGFGEGDKLDYRQGLAQLDVVTRERLLAGDWLVSEQGVFKPDWFRRFRHPDVEGGGSTYKLLNSRGEIASVIPPADCHRFFTIDPAGTSQERKRQAKGADPCWSTCSVWDYTPSGELLWRRVVRLQGEFPEVMEAIRRTYAEERPSAIWLEVDGIGRPYYQQLSREQFPVYALSSEGKDKLTRATPATHEAAAGRVYLPKHAPWLDSLESELFAWQGTSDEVCDQIDTLAYAVLLKIRGSLGGVIQLQ